MANDWLAYANQGATRNQHLDPRLVQAMGFLPEMGLTMEVFSGGQPGVGTGGARVGSTRHDHGNAADVFFRQNGQRLDWANPQHTPMFQEIVRRAKGAGVTGFGAGQGYMQPGSMHIGYGTPGVWGAGGKSGNAADWLVQAYGSAPAGAAQTVSFGAGTPAIDPIAMMFGGAGEQFNMGASAGGIADMFGGVSQSQVRDQKAKADEDRRRSLFANVGSWFG